MRKLKYGPMYKVLVFLILISPLIGNDLIAQNGCDLITALAGDLDGPNGTGLMDVFDDLPTGDGAKAYEGLFMAGKVNAKQSPDAVRAFSKLNEESKASILQFSDNIGGSTPSTLIDFLSSADDAVIAAMNMHPSLAAAIVGHKTGFVSADYVNAAEVLDDLEGLPVASKQFLSDWLDRSANLANFTGAARMGIRLSDNIVESLEDGTRIRTLLQDKLGVDLSTYTVHTEIPFEVPVTSSTPGGFMKADVVLIKTGPLGIEDVIVIENKLNFSTNFTPAQTMKFSEVKNASPGTVQFKVKFSRPNDGLVAGQQLSVDRSKVVKINDSGSDDINSVNPGDLHLIQDLTF